MAYDKQDIFEKAKKHAENEELFYIEDIIAYLPCGKSKFYEFFPADSEEMDALKAILEANKVKKKVAMRDKWYRSDNATLQVSLMKLLATEEELKRLAMNYNQNDNTHNGNLNHTHKVDISKLSDEDLRKLAEIQSKLSE